MYNFIKLKNTIEKLIYKKDDMPEPLRKLFSTTEFLAYSVASLIIIYSVILTSVYLFYFIKSKQDDPYLLYQIRLFTGQLLNISLTLILGGLIVRLLHITNLKTLLLIVITIFIKEMIISSIDKETSLISKKINVLREIKS